MSNKEQIEKTSNKFTKSTKSSKPKEVSIVEFLEQRKIILEKLDKQDLMYLTIFFEYKSNVLDNEMKIIQAVEEEKYKILSNEKFSDEEIENKINALSGVLESKLDKIIQSHDIFDDFFENFATENSKLFLDENQENLVSF